MCIVLQWRLTLVMIILENGETQSRLNEINIRHLLCQNGIRYVTFIFCFFVTKFETKPLKLNRLSMPDQGSLFHPFVRV